MKYDHMVKYHGIYYPAGADVPAGDTEAKVAIEVEEELPFVDVPAVEETVSEVEIKPATAPKKKGGRKKKQ